MGREIIFGTASAFGGVTLGFFSFLSLVIINLIILSHVINSCLLIYHFFGVAVSLITRVGGATGSVLVGGGGGGGDFGVSSAI